MTTVAAPADPESSRNEAAPDTPRPAAPSGSRASATLLVLAVFSAVVTTVGDSLRTLHGDVSSQTWTLSGMSLGLAVALLTVGALADDFGRRRVLVLLELAARADEHPGRRRAEHEPADCRPDPPGHRRRRHPRGVARRDRPRVPHRTPPCGGHRAYGERPSAPASPSDRSRRPRLQRRSGGGAASGSKRSQPPP